MRAGVSKGTLYLYYPSKAELFKAVIRENLGRPVADGVGAMDTCAAASSVLLRNLISTWWERVGATPASAIHKIVLSEARNFPEIAEFYLREVVRPAQALFARILARGIDRGEFRSVPLAEATAAMCAPMMYLCLHRHSFDLCGLSTLLPDPVDVLATHVDMVLTGLLRRGAEPVPVSDRAGAGHSHRDAGAGNG